jgi:hypothetical protein
MDLFARALDPGLFSVGPARKSPGEVHRPWREGQVICGLSARVAEYRATKIFEPVADRHAPFCEPSFRIGCLIELPRFAKCSGRCINGFLGNDLAARTQVSKAGDSLAHFRFQLVPTATGLSREKGVVPIVGVSATRKATRPARLRKLVPCGGRDILPSALCNHPYIL